MGTQETSTASSSGPAISSGNENARRSILSDVQWVSLARSLQLSERELQIVQCIFDDYTGAGMARQLGISVHTINTHLERLYRKLHVNTRAGAVVRIFAEHLDRRTPS